MKFRLVVPPTFEGLFIFVPIGMATLKSYLGKHHEVSQIDLAATIQRLNRERTTVRPTIKVNLFTDLNKAEKFLQGERNEDFEKELKKIIDIIKPSIGEIICFSASNFVHMLFSLMLAKEIKKHHGNKIILGGSFLTSSYDSYLFEKFHSVDIITVGRIENNYPKLMAAIESGKRRLIISEGGKAEFLVPDYSGLELGDYTYGNKSVRLPIETSVGCVHNCAFCNFSGKSTYQAFEGKKVAKGISELRDKYHTNYFHLINESLNIVDKDMTKFLTAIKGMGIKWSSYARIDLLDPKTIHLLKESGCDLIAFGLESASPNVLRKMHKEMNVKKTTEKMMQIVKEKIKIQLSVIYGFPGETAEDRNMTLEYLLKNSRLFSLIVTNHFGLRSGSKMHRNPELFGITKSSNPKLIQKIIADEIYIEMDNKSVQKAIDTTKKINHSIMRHNNSPLSTFIPYRFYAFMARRRTFCVNRMVDYSFHLAENKLGIFFTNRLEGDSLWRKDKQDF